MGMELDDLEAIPDLRRRKNREEFLGVFDNKRLLTSTEIAKKLGYTHRSAIHFARYFKDDEVDDYRIELMGPEDSKPRYYWGKKEVVAKFRTRLKKIAEARKKDDS